MKASSGAVPSALRKYSASVTVETGDVLVPALVRALDEAGAPASRVVLREPTLDDVFLSLTGRSLRDSGDTPAPEAADEPADPVPAHDFSEIR